MVISFQVSLMAGNSTTWANIISQEGSASLIRRCCSGNETFSNSMLSGHCVFPFLPINFFQPLLHLFRVPTPKWWPVSVRTSFCEQNTRVDHVYTWVRRLNLCVLRNIKSATTTSQTEENVSWQSWCVWFVVPHPDLSLQFPKQEISCQLRNAQLYYAAANALRCVCALNEKTV
jgi:hypothetical protein